MRELQTRKSAGARMNAPLRHCSRRRMTCDHIVLLLRARGRGRPLDESRRPLRGTAPSYRRVDRRQGEVARDADDRPARPATGTPLASRDFSRRSRMAAEAAMNWFVRTCRSSVGAKLVMALTGILLFGFVIAHLLGNLQAFAGAEKLNRYGEALRELGPLLWIARLAILAIALVHVATALRL